MDLNDPRLPARYWCKVVVGPLPTGSGDPLMATRLITPCWLWTGSRTRRGYGKFWAWSERLGREGLRQAHVVAWEQANATVLPAGFHTDHLCRVPSCVNPDHLEMVTPRENVLRGKLTTAEYWETRPPLPAPTADEREAMRMRAVARLTPSQRERYEARRAWNAMPAEERAARIRERVVAYVQSESARAARRGRKNAACKLTEDQVKSIRAMGGDSRTIASKFGVSGSLVLQIKKRKKWAWLE